MSETIGVVKAVCLSAKRGEQKQNTQSAQLIAGWGIEGDAHAGDWDRQVSLLAYDKIQQFNELGAGVGFGDFGENLVVEGINLSILPVGALLNCGESTLEITQIGKQCHDHCQIYDKMGDCIMPREGVFARVKTGGLISVGDEITAQTQSERPLKAAVITLSDKGAAGEREDKSGPIAKELLETAGYRVEHEIMLPDNRDELERALIELSDTQGVDLVITTGGTGFSTRDTTPEATLSIADRAAPGIAEAIRAHSMSITARAMLSRGVSVIRKGTLIINLPGSPKAVRESLEFVLPHIKHGIEILRGSASECGRG
ncbi:MAG: molybdopterin-binding protein [Oscillospiraceae bacterium]|nr:molybdopterin-binding protein [Oscillospiraceae bacterium]